MKNIFKLHIDNLARQKPPVLNAKPGASEASLYIYDVISADWGIGALAVVEAIAQVNQAQTLHVHINSPGGDVFEGRAIMAAIDRFEGRTVAHIDSLCASAATSIALACDEVEISEGAFFMIHNASTMAWGDKAALRDVADLLQKIEGSIVDDYRRKTGLEREQIAGWMDAETWFSAEEAHKNGFVDRVIAAQSRPKNKWNLSAYANVPEAIREVNAQSRATPEPGTENTQDLESSGMGTSNANRLRLIQIA
jgi:ATP-dependent Clp protease protease subunit